MTHKSRISKSLAVHEAAHAVVAIDYGVDFHLVRVLTPEECRAGPYVDRRGRQKHAAGFMEGGHWFPMPPNKHREERLPLMRAHAIVTLAGPEAEVRFSRRDPLLVLRGGLDDAAAVSGMLGEFATNMDEEIALRKSLHEETRLTLRRPEIWSAVMRVAFALQERRELTREDVATIAGCKSRFNERAIWPDAECRKDLP